MEKHSEDQIYKNKPETRNGNVYMLTMIFELFAWSLFKISEHAIANVG